MTPVASFFLACLYLVVTVVVATKEYRKIGRRGGDSFTIVLVFVIIYLLLPSIGINSLLAVSGADLRTGNSFFDRVFDQLNFLDSLAVFLLTTLFILGLYLSAGLGRTGGRPSNRANKELQMKGLVVFWGISALALICGSFFMALGGSFPERYANLILFRGLDASAERTFFSANAFSLTQTLTWLAAGVFFVYLAEKNRPKALAYFFLMLAAAFLMGSRRGFIFPILIIYFCTVLLYTDLHLWKLTLFIPLIVFWVSFGEELTGSIAYDVDAEMVFGGYTSVSSMMLRAFSDVGISQIQSFAVLQHFDAFPPRFGIDHALSALRKFPDGMIGLNIDWPERIVRITTRIFASQNDADIPPGLVGQSWLDFPFLGALFWGLVVGAQCRLLDRWASRFAHTPAKVVLVTLIALVIALPINTGSYDFTFSIDIIILALLLVLFFRVRRLSRG